MGFTLCQTNTTTEHHHAINGKTQYKWPIFHGHLKLPEGSKSFLGILICGVWTVNSMAGLWHCFTKIWLWVGSCVQLLDSPHVHFGGGFAGCGDHFYWTYDLLWVTTTSSIFFLHRLCSHFLIFKLRSSPLGTLFLLLGILNWCTN